MAEDAEGFVCLHKRHGYSSQSPTFFHSLSASNHSALATCVIRFESRRRRVCPGTIVMISGVARLCVVLPLLGCVLAVVQLVDAVG